LNIRASKTRFSASSSEDDDDDVGNVAGQQPQPCPLNTEGGYFTTLLGLPSGKAGKLHMK